MRKKFLIDKSFFDKINMSDKVIFLHYNTKKGKINGLKHNSIIIDELPKVKFDYKEMVKLTEKVMKNEK